MTYKSPGRFGFQCLRCTHYLDWNNDGESYCKAFKKIPNKIFDGEIDHTQPYHGDNGILFSPRRDIEYAAETQYEIFHQPPLKPGELMPD